MEKIDLKKAIVPNWLEKEEIEEHFGIKLTDEEFEELKTAVEEKLTDDFSFYLHQEVEKWIEENMAEPDPEVEYDRQLAQQELYDMDKDAFDPSWQDYDFEYDIP
ncbi:putative IQ calmodulin-binding motif family protein (plasmid) [Persephonella marina EX-H1]|uniref:Putative IQ calmodulin-binding motif family protein n=1 Tax=Persephonella marina (strain DSM 14350 / EX-H1) TaxID=123214 RepID=C0QUU7_PERMH|nr:hypothetical protein [Persephonella marina]ACO04957.1 putative IQ calmodulin-binding motif family protein [Persephonella marina EX-H1]